MSKHSKKNSHRESLGKRLATGFGEFTETVEALFKRVARSIAEFCGMLFSLLIPRSLLRRMEDVGKSQGAQQLGKQVGEFTDEVEKKFSKGALGVLDVLQNLFAILVPEFIRVRVARVADVVWTRIRDTSRQLAKGLDHLAEKYLPKWLVRAVKQTWRRIQKWLRSLRRFVWSWSRSRDLKKLAWATPAILLAIPLAAGVALSPAYSNSERIQHYNVAYGKALEEQDFDKADLYARKLSQLGYQRMERAEYQEAMTLARAGQFDEAYTIMQTIAPESEPGYLFGHLWIAGALRTGSITSVPAEDVWRLVKIHADHATSLEEDNRYAQYLQIKVQQEAGLPVILDMKRLADAYPEFYGELMVHYVQAGEIGDARTAASRFSDYVETIRPQDRTLSNYMLWAAAQEMLGNIKKSQEITVEGSIQFENAPELKQMAAFALLAELKTIDQNSDQALELLKTAHLADPQNAYVIRSLGSRLANDNTGKMRRIIDELKGNKQLNVEIILTAGDVHARASRFDDAQKYYLEACDYDPNTGRGYNNIAWIYANVNPINLGIALGAVNQALEIEADAEFFETRGQIYFKRSRDDWQKAADDLEVAVNGVLPELDRQNAHRSLATIYDAFGEKERAAAHLQQSQPRVVESRLALQP